MGSCAEVHGSVLALGWRAAKRNSRVSSGVYGSSRRVYCGTGGGCVSRLCSALVRAKNIGSDEEC